MEEVRGGKAKLFLLRSSFPPPPPRSYTWLVSTMQRVDRLDIFLLKRNRETRDDENEDEDEDEDDENRDEEDEERGSDEKARWGLLLLLLQLF